MHNSIHKFEQPLPLPNVYENDVINMLYLELFYVFQYLYFQRNLTLVVLRAIEIANGVDDVSRIHSLIMSLSIKM